jgi:hypothetical protein
MAFDQYKNWMAKSTGLVPIEHILSIDIDELQANEYRQLFKDSLIVQDNPSDGYVVGATNAAAKHAKGDILIYLSDDFDCPTQWDVLIRHKLTDGKEQLLKVDDCLQGFNVAVLTIPIMTRAFYDRFGYFFYLEYKSMFCDEDLYHVARLTNTMVLAPDLKFPHLHPSNPTETLRAQNDTTYNRSSAMWEQGKAIHQKRKAINYGL